MTLGALLQLLEDFPDHWEIVVYDKVVGYLGNDFKEIIRLHFTRQLGYERSVYKNYAVPSIGSTLQITIYAKKPGGTWVKHFA